jgi:tripartite-type tricarboxylate transporter receptor subunit TctC
MKETSMYRRCFARAVLAAVATTVVLCAPAPTAAQAPYPSRPIRIIIPFAGGSGSDIIARVVGEAIGQKLGVPVVPETREGGGGAIGATMVAKSAPDGYTLLSAANPMTVTPYMMKSPPYDPAKDFAPIARVAVIPLVLVTGSQSTYKTFQDLAMRMKAEPGKVNYATGGKGSPSHLEVELFLRVLGVQARDVPYKNIGQGLTDTIGGRTDFIVASLPISMAHIQSGSLRALAVGSPTRLATLPDVPTLAELLGKPGYDASAWYGFMAPAGTPPDVVTRLGDEVQKSVALPEVRARIEGTGGRIALAGPAEFNAQIQAESEKWGRLVREMGLTMD